MKKNFYSYFMSKFKEFDFTSKQYCINNVNFNVYVEKKNFDQFKYIDYYINDFSIDQNIITTFNLYCIEDTIFLGNIKKLIENSKFKIIKNFSGHLESNEFHEIFDIEKGEKLFINTRNGYNYAIFKKDSSFYIIAKENTLYKKQQALRVIRELLLRTLENYGYIFFHSAAINYNNKGIMIIGNSGTGKTTLMSHLLNNLNSNFISNDRVFLKKENYISLRYFPLPIRLGIGTIKSISQLRSYISNHKLFRTQNTMFADKELNLVLDKYNVFLDKNKIELTPLEFTKALNLNTIEKTVLNLIIVPNIIKESDKISIKELNSIDKNRVLSENCFTPKDESWINPWLIERNEPDIYYMKVAEKLIEYIIENIPVISVTFGTNTDVELIPKKLNKYLLMSQNHKSQHFRAKGFEL